MPRLFEEVFRRLPVCVALLDPQGRALFASDDLRGLLGERSETSGKSGGMDLAALFGHAASFDELACRVKGEGGRLILRGVPWKNVSRETRSFDCLWTVLGGEEPDEKREDLFLLMLTDVTDRERSRAFEERLCHAAKLTAMGEMMASLAHEINNPLSVVSGNAQFLDSTFGRQTLDRISSEDWKEIVASVRSILDQSDRCCKFVSSLLQFSCRPRASREPLAALCLNGVIEDLLHVYEPSLLKEKIRVSKRFDAGLPVVLADPDQLYQVFLNLICNARAAMPGGGSLEIETACQDRWVTTVVRDTGVGIGKELLKRLFEPFYTTKSPGKGTGLGLTIARSIVTRFGGTIEAASEEGRGAEFIVRLPRAAAAESDERAPCPRGEER